MRIKSSTRSFFPSQLAVILLASAVGIPALAQQGQSSTTPQSTPPQAVQPSSVASPSQHAPAKEGFWGRVNPFARKVWVKKQTDYAQNSLLNLQIASTLIIHPQLARSDSFRLILRWNQLPRSGSSCVGQECPSQTEGLRLRLETISTE